MKLARVQQSHPHSEPVIEVEPEFLFASVVLIHVERLEGVRVLAKRSWIMSDSFEAEFEYADRLFSMSLPFGSITIAPKTPGTPADVLERLAAHIDAYRTVWPTQWLWAIVRYFFLPFRARG